MNGDPDRKTWGERPNQPPKPECCRTEGQAQASAADVENRTTVWKRTQGDSQAASGSRTPLKQSSLETIQYAGGDGVASPEPNTEETVSGEVSGDLPGSKSVAREERAVRKLGSPAASRGTNCGGQTGQEVQRQEDLPTGVAIYETDFLDCSYGYRPGRNPLQAVRALTDALQRGQFEFIVEAHFEL